MQTVVLKDPPPSATNTGLLGDLRAFAHDRLPLLVQWAQADAPILRLRFAWATQYVISAPEYVQQVLQGNHRNYIKEQTFMRTVRLAAGPARENLFTSDGKDWLYRRRLMQPAFHRRCIEGYTQHMVNETSKLLQRWERLPAHSTIEVRSAMTDVTMEVISLCMLGTDLQRAHEQMKRIFKASSDFVISHSSALIKWPLAVPTPTNRRLNQAMEAITTLLTELIEQRRQALASGAEPEFLIDMLLLSHDEETGQGFSDDELRAELGGIIFAGHETTASALSWTFHLLAQNPAAEAQLHAEVDRVLQGRAPTLADLPQLQYTSQVFQEALRIYPPAWITSRQALNADQFGDYGLPAGAQVLLNIYGIHHNPAYWEQPEQFRPERFAPDQLSKQVKHTYLPFATGPRKCIGDTFAQTEAQIILAMIAQRYRLRRRDDTPVAADVGFIMQPKGGLPMQLEPR